MTSLQQAVKILKAGGIVVYPTDTAYGLAVDATNLAAVKKLYRLKGRGFKKPVHVIVSTDLLTVPYYSNATAKKLIKKFWPGPLTIILPLKLKGKSWQMLSSNTKNIGVRLPNNPVALTLVKKFGKPITGTSANISGQPNCYSVAEVKKQFVKAKFKPDFYLDGGKLPKRSPSTVVLVTKGVKILREGPITETQIKHVLLFSTSK